MPTLMKIKKNLFGKDQSKRGWAQELVFLGGRGKGREVEGVYHIAATLLLGQLRE